MSPKFTSFLVHLVLGFVSLQLLCYNGCLLLQQLSLPPKTSLLKLEDPVCANGGKRTLTFSRGKSDYSWLCTLQALIGEQFDHGDEICGAVVNVRNRQEKIALWTKNAANEAAEVSIGKQWKGILESNETIGFIFHEDAGQDESSAKNSYRV